MSSKGHLFVISAASGTGKSSLCRALLQREPSLALSVSFTSRQPRPGEQEGRDYHFVSARTFLDMIEAGEFFEYADVLGDYKGTARASVEPLLETGRDVLLEIDWQGAQQVRSRIPDCTTIFILPPSRETLEQRLRGRGQDPEATIRHRLASAASEVSHAREFDYIVINDDFDTATDELRAIIHVQRLRTEKQRVRHADLLHSLLEGFPAAER